MYRIYYLHNSQLFFMDLRTLMEVKIKSDFLTNNGYKIARMRDDEGKSVKLP